MNRMQIVLALGLSVLGVEPRIERYRTICNLVYLASKEGVFLSPSRIELSDDGYAYSPMSHESGGQPASNLLSDLMEIGESARYGEDITKAWRLDEQSENRLRKLRKNIQRHGLDVLMNRQMVMRRAIREH